MLKLLFAIHITAGFIALGAAPGALATVKGGQWHRRWGAIYFWSMLAVAVTAVGISWFRPTLFLTLTAVFSFYMAFSGYRVLYRKRSTDKPKWCDWFAAIATIAASIGLEIWGIRQLNAGRSFGWVAIVFGVVGLIFSGRDLKAFIRPPTDPRQWLYRHIGNMIGAYIATVTAFSAVNLKFLPPLARWLWAIAVGVPILVATVQHYKRKASTPTRT